MAEPRSIAFDEAETTERVRAWLLREGFQADEIRALKPTGRGVDLVANGPAGRWHIEVKGGTSSRRGSIRDGKGFTSNQIIDRVMKGFFTAAAMAEAEGRGAARVGLAIPRSALAEFYVGKVRSAMAALGIAMLWVEEDGSVVVANDSQGRNR
ncbi:hypothetical protein [Siccirubricoccus phaeus]|uniref:hypothetical protein n=1 Tax=Siccirubricoccus phaeus TaxID=2595053 RepID=UPI0011F23F5F|nr:hypothetical protein [Siccirubricoccus phaeus]